MAEVTFADTPAAEPEVEKSTSKQGEFDQLLGSEPARSEAASRDEEMEGRQPADVPPLMINGKKKKIAFLFLTRASLHQETVWKNFFEDADPELFNIYCHAKERTLIKYILPLISTRSVLREGLIDEVVDTAWGDVSLVRATLAMLRAAVEDETNFKFVLCSESCVPLYNFDTLYKIACKDDKAWLRVADTPMQQLHQKHGERDFHRFNEKLRTIVPQEDQLLKQQQWMIFNREMAEIYTKKENDFTHLWQGLFAADEHYFVNVMAHLRGRQALEAMVHNQRVTYVAWSANKAPVTYDVIQQQHVQEARADGCLFMRKVKPGTDTRVLLQEWAKSTTARHYKDSRAACHSAARVCFTPW